MKVDMTLKEAAAIVATTCGTFTSEEVDEVIFVVKRQCPNCHYPHIYTVFGTPESDKIATGMLGYAIGRIADEGLFDG